MTHALEMQSTQTPSDIELQEIELGHTEETDTPEVIQQRFKLAQQLAARATSSTIPKLGEWGPAHHRKDFVLFETPITDSTD